MPAITSANVANAIVKLVAVDAVPALMGNLVMGALVNRSFEPVLAEAGDTVNVPIPPVLTANVITENPAGTVTTQAPNAGNAQIVLNTHAEATFQIPDVTKVLAVPDLMALYMQPAMVALAEKIETDLLATYSLFTTNSPLGSGGVAITEAILDSAETTLFKAKVPPGAQRNLVVDGDTYGQIRQLPRFSETQTVGPDGKAISTGEVGLLKGFRIQRSQFVAKTGSAPVTTQNLAFHSNAIGLVTRRLPQPLPGTGAIAQYAELGNFGLRVVMSYQPSTLAQQFTVDVLYGIGVLRNNHAVVVRT
jgi:hypothetical protein